VIIDFLNWKRNSKCRDEQGWQLKVWRGTSFSEVIIDLRRILDMALVDEIRKSTNGNFVLGKWRFVEEIERTLKQRAISCRSGGPATQSKEIYVFYPQFSIVRNLKRVMALSFMCGVFNVTAATVVCDGKVTQVLSGAAYCSAGERVGFSWSGGTGWICSSNKNMDALVITAYTTGKTISVRDNTWTSCSPPDGSVPQHIWFLQ
jgi:hypothetical protein